MVLLLAVLIIGQEYNGAQRWLNLGFATFQPSEFAKIAVVILSAVVLSRIDYIGVKETAPNIISVGIILAVYAILLLLQPHLSAIIIVVGTLGIMMLVAGIPLRVFTPIAGLGVAAIAILSIASPYRMERMMSFMDPFKYKSDEGYQAVQSLYAIGSGGFSGLGLGRSRQKYLYIPEPQNDFIYSIICEELGFLGAILVIALFVLLLWRAVKIALNAPDRFSMILVCGLISLTIVQVILNIGVATSSIPPTGIPLPFFSAGGTSFVFQMISMGIILNVSRQPKITLE
jgi:cell division protein FtsW